MVESALLAAIPVGSVVYLIERWLTQTGRTQSIYRWCVITLLFAIWALAFWLIKDLVAASAVASFESAGFWLGQAHASTKHTDRGSQ